MSTKRKRPSRSPLAPKQAEVVEVAATSAPVEAEKPLRRRRPFLRHVGLVVATTLYTVGVLLVPYAASNSVFIYSTYALLALATIVFVPTSRPKAIGHFGLVWAISLIASPAWVVPVLVVGHCWAVCANWAARPGPVLPSLRLRAAA